MAMTSDEAKVILSVWRPDGSDSSDPAFRNALELARNDPMLLEWLQEQQDFDMEMTNCLGTVRGPVEGCQAVLAQAPMILRQRSRMRRFRWVVAAACLAAAAVVGFQQLVLIDRVLPREPFAVADAAEHLSVHHKEMEYFSDDAGELRGWLTGRESPYPNAMPGKLANLRAYGAQDWRTPKGRVSLICFYSEKSPAPDSYTSDAEWIHLFTFSDDLSRLSGAAAVPRVVDGPEWVFVVWSDAENAYALGLPAKEGARERLEALMGS